MVRLCRCLLKGMQKAKGICFSSALQFDPSGSVATTR